MPATMASHSAPPVHRRAALRSSVVSLDTWKTTLARTSASVNTCRASQPQRLLPLSAAALSYTQLLP